MLVLFQPQYMVNQMVVVVGDATILFARLVHYNKLLNSLDHLPYYNRLLSKGNSM